MRLDVRPIPPRTRLPAAHSAALGQALSGFEVLGRGRWELSIEALDAHSVALILNGPAEPQAHAAEWHRTPSADGSTASYRRILDVEGEARDVAARAVRAVRTFFDSRRRGKPRTHDH
jgi:hypothetical protein